MSYTMTQHAGGISVGTDLAKQFEVSGAARMGIEESVSDGASDQQIAMDLDISTIQGILIVSDQDLTVKTNDSGTPDDTLNLTGGVPEQYAASPAFGSNPFSTDLTDLYVTNNSGAEATLQIEVVYDPTP